MAADSPLVSVICADTGARHEFREALRSLRAQTGVAWELLVVGFPNLDLAEAFDDRVHIVSNTATNIADRRNVGLDAARGDVVTFQEGGDVLGVASLERRIALVRSGKADVVYCNAECTDSDLRALGYARSGRAVLTFADAHTEPALLSSVLGRRETMRRARFDPERGGAADWAYLARLLRAGVQIARADDCEILHRLGPDRAKPVELLEAERHRLAVLDHVYGPDDECPDAAPEWRNGLSEPDRGLVRTRRLAGLIVRQLLADDVDPLAQAVELVAGAAPQSGVDLRSVVEMATAEALACPLAAVRSRLSRGAGRISALADEADLFDRLPELTVDLARAGLPLATNRPLIAIAMHDSTSLPAPGEDIIGPFERGEARLREHELVHELLTRGCPRPGRMVDVGAHIGGSLRPFCADGWTVHAFEPDPVNRAGLVKRARPLWHLDIDDRAVSDRTGETVEFFSTPESTGASSLTAFTDSHVLIATVRTVTLRDALGADDGIGHVHFLKTDVEGHDLPALKGFWWERDRPDVVLCEFEDNKTRHAGYTTEDLAQFLVDRGYEVFVSEWHPIVRYGIVHDFKRFYRFCGGTVSNLAWGNLIAVGSTAGASRLVELAAAGVGLDRSPIVIRPAAAHVDGVPQDQPQPVVGAGVNTQPNRAVRVATSIARWYASASGLLLAVSLVLLALAFIGAGPWRLFGVLGVAVLAVFLPWKLSALHGRSSTRLDVLARQLAEMRKRTDALPSSVAAGAPREGIVAAMRADLRALRLSTAASVARTPSASDGADATEDRQ